MVGGNRLGLCSSNECRRRLGSIGMVPSLAALIGVVYALCTLRTACVLCVLHTNGVRVVLCGVVL